MISVEQEGLQYVIGLSRNPRLEGTVPVTPV